MSELEESAAAAARAAGWLPVDEVARRLSEQGHVRLSDIRARLNELIDGLEGHVELPDQPFLLRFKSHGKDGLVRRHAMALLARSYWHAKIVLGGWHERATELEIEPHPTKARAVILEASEGVFLPEGEDETFRAGLEQGGRDGARFDRPTPPNRVPAGPGTSDPQRAAWAAGYRLGHCLAGHRSEEATALIRLLDPRLTRSLQHALS